MGNNRKESDAHIVTKMDEPFQGQYYMHEDKGIYKCMKCDQPLFSSKAKINTGSGWPSFDKALKDAVETHKGDYERGEEVHCSVCKQFVGLLIKGENFTDAKLRYDINSSAVKFVPDRSQQA